WLISTKAPIVAQLHSASIAEARGGDSFASELRLGVAEGDAQCRDVVVLRGVHDQSAPSTADVEQTLTRLQTQLAADEVELGFLRTLQIVVVMREVGARVHHARIQPERVKRIANVVVKPDGVEITALGMSLSRET